MRYPISHLTDWYDKSLPSGISLLLPQLLRTMLLYQLSPGLQPPPDDTFFLRRFGRHIPPKILEAYSHMFDSFLAYILAHEPQNVPFLPKGRELQEFCLTCSREPLVAFAVLQEIGEYEQNNLRRKAQTLSLDLPESFTRLPEIQLVSDAPTQALERAGSWHTAFLNGLLSLSDAMVLRTETHLFGIAKCLMQQDDEIWILDAAFAPICLRPLPNGKYQFLGEVYMEGIMDGEAVQFCNDPVSITLE
jgi:hypothetical protein